MNKKVRTILDVQSEIDRAAKEFSEHIDREIFEGVQSEILRDKGWTWTPLDCGFLYRERIAKTSEWIHVHATGDYKFLNGHWLFERAEDATMFTLKFCDD